MTGYLGRHARRQASRLRLGALSLAIVATGAVSANADAWWSPVRPIVYDAGVGERVTVEPVWVRVNDVRTATAVIDGGQEFDTSGAWVLVDVTAAALNVPERIERLLLRDGRGREYDATTRVSNPMLEAPFEPGIPERGDAVFEVSADALKDLTLIVHADQPNAKMPRAEAEIPLQVDAPGAQAVELRPRLLATETQERAS